MRNFGEKGLMKNEKELKRLPKRGEEMRKERDRRLINPSKKTSSCEQGCVSFSLLSCLVVVVAVVVTVSVVILAAVVDAYELSIITIVHPLSVEITNFSQFIECVSDRPTDGQTHGCIVAKMLGTSETFFKPDGNVSPTGK